jgi:hypothetical protein
MFMAMGWLFAALLITLLLVRGAIAYAHRRGMLDQPGQRRSHRLADAAWWWHRRRGGDADCCLAHCGACRQHGRSVVIASALGALCWWHLHRLVGRSPPAAGVAAIRGSCWP